MAAMDENESNLKHGGLDHFQDGTYYFACNEDVAIAKS
jgi:hypothetical protein